jgi:hypothetical protein
MSLMTVVKADPFNLADRIRYGDSETSDVYQTLDHIFYSVRPQGV